MWNDPVTYVAIYVLSLVIAVPTIRLMLKDVTPYDDDFMYAQYLAALLLFIGAPITVIVYWVGFQFIGKVVMHQILWRLVLLPIGNMMVSEATRERYNRTRER